MKKTLFVGLILAMSAGMTFGAISQSEMQSLMAGFGIINTSQGVDNGANVVQSNVGQQAIGGWQQGAQSMSAIIMQAGSVLNPGTLLMGGSLIEGQTQLAAGPVMTETQTAAIDLDTAAAKTGTGTAITGNQIAITNANQALVGNGATTVNALAAAGSQFVGVGPGCDNPAAVVLSGNICVQQSNTVVTPICMPQPPCPPAPPCPVEPDC